MVTSENEELDWLHGEAGSVHLHSHLDYTAGMRQVRVGQGLDELTIKLQQSNYEKIPQNFLLLLQTLFYMGQHDSVVELSRQMISKEISPSSFFSSKSTDDEDHKLMDSKLLQQIKTNASLCESRFWLILAQSLEYQHRFKDANQAYKISLQLNTIDQNSQARSCIDISINRRYADFNLKRKRDFRVSIDIIDVAHRESGSVASRLALIQSISRPLTFGSQLKRALQTIHHADLALMSSQNPSADYNCLSRRCRGIFDDELEDLTDSVISDAERGQIELTLAKSHLLLNEIASDKSSGCLYNIGQSSRNDDPLWPETKAKIDRIIDSIRNLKSTALSSAAPWNNLALCYLLSKRFIACLSCLHRAQRIEPLDWRVNFNLAITYANVGLISRALVSLHRCVSLYANHSQSFRDHKNPSKSFSTTASCLKSLLAVCAAGVDDLDESRQLHIESQLEVQQVPILCQLNYLIFLHMSADKNDEQTIKTKQNLLDQLEQGWLQRNQNNPQFNRCLLQVADAVVLDMVRRNEMIPKTFAWAKAEIVDSNNK